MIAELPHLVLVQLSVSFGSVIIFTIANLLLFPLAFLQHVLEEENEQHLFISEPTMPSPPPKHTGTHYNIFFIG